MRPVVCAVALALTLAGCVGAAAGDSGRGFVAGNGSVQMIPAAQRHDAPVVEAATLDGRQLSLADMDGPVVVNFWASWCGPCASEAPELEATSKAFDDVTFVGVNVKDTSAAALAFERDFGITYPSWDDPSSTIAASFGGIGPGALPSTLILDGNHRVAAQFFGAVNQERLTAALNDVLAEDP